MNRQPTFERLEPRTLYSVAAVDGVFGVDGYSIWGEGQDPTVLAGRQGETLGRGVHAQYTGDGVYVNWRFLAEDPAAVGFNVYRDGGTTPLNGGSPITGATQYFDPDANLPAGPSVQYTVVPVLNGLEGPTRGTAVVNITVPQNYDVIATSMSTGKVGIGELDGDGDYDYVLQTPAFTSDPYKDLTPSPTTYKLHGIIDGQLAWTYDRGGFIDTGIWYSPFIVYDFNGDGIAEIAAKGYDGTEDPAQHAGYNGLINSGPEHLIILNGATGQVMDHADWPSRADMGDPNDRDDFNNQSRNQLAVAYLDGVTPSIIAGRGTYGYMKASAYELDGTTLTLTDHWESGHEPGDGPGVLDWRRGGAHSIRTADVDNDGRDEVLLGAIVLDENLEGLWSTALKHPDQVYVGDLDPHREGMEVYHAYEDTNNGSHGDLDGLSLWDADSGDRIWKVGEKTVGVQAEGVVSDIDPTHDGAEFYSKDDGNNPKTWMFSADRQPLDHASTFYDNRFTYDAVYWDSDAQRELVVDNSIFDYATHPTELLYDEDFNFWWDEWTLTSVTGLAERGVSGVVSVFHVSNDSWDNTLTWNQQVSSHPYSTPFLAQEAVAPSGEWMDWDLTSLAESQRQDANGMSVLLRGAQNFAGFHGTGDRPRLVIETSGGTQTLYAVESVTTSQSDPNQTQAQWAGANTDLYAHSSNYRTLLRFDLTEINQTILSAELQALSKGSDTTGSAKVRQGGQNQPWSLAYNEEIAVTAGEKIFLRVVVDNENGYNPTHFVVDGYNSSGTLVQADLTAGQTSYASGEVEQARVATFTVPTGVTGLRLSLTSSNTMSAGISLTRVTLLQDDQIDSRYKGTTLPGRVLGTADLYGDWREEIIVTVDNEIRIYSTSIEATDRRVTLMQDPLYRQDVVTQSMGYRQTPQTSYWLAGTTSSAPASETPQLKWEFDGNADDSSGTGQDATLVGGSYESESQSGTGSVLLDGADDYVELAGSGSTGPLHESFTQRSVAAWIKPTSTSGTQVIFEQGGSGKGIALRLNNDQLEAKVKEGSDSLTLSTAFTSTDWSHVAVVFKAGELTLYVNGMQMATGAATFSQVTTHSSPATAGGKRSDDVFSGGSGDYFGGNIDQLLVFDAAISEDHVVDLSTAPQLKWEFDGNADDSSGTGLDATLVGGTYDSESQSGSGSVLLDGVNDYVELAGSGSTGPLHESFTRRYVAAWIKPTSTSGTQVIFEQGGSAKGIALRIHNGQLEAKVKQDNESLTLSTAFTSTNWSHVAVVFDAGQLTLYVNGMQAAPGLATFAQVTTHNSPATAGGKRSDDVFSGGSGDYFGGNIDQLLVFDAAFDSSRVLELASSPF